jgi:hypothetical protein
LQKIDESFQIFFHKRKQISPPKKIELALHDLPEILPFFLSDGQFGWAESQQLPELDFKMKRLFQCK